MKLEQEIIKARLKDQLGIRVSSKIVIIGLGVTGVSVADYLAGLGFDFVIADSREQPPGLEQARVRLGNRAIFLGEFDSSSFVHASHLVVSPGVSLKEPALIEASNHGVCVLSDIDLFACSTDAPVIAITGSNGKSTVTTMVGEMAKADGRKVGVGGNLGLPALDLLKEDAELYVLELSSFQLERTTQLNAAAAAVLNISADHLDRHSDMADYAAQKQRIFHGHGVMVLNADDPQVVAMQESSRMALSFSINGKANFYLGHQGKLKYLMAGERAMMVLSELPLEGKHNAANALAAMALGAAVGLDGSAMCKALKNFKGLPHRMQRVISHNGVTWVNDSKATNIGACIAALQGYDEKVILIAGGDAKGADMNELAPVIKAKTKAVVLIGKDAGLIEKALGKAVPVGRAVTMQEAVTIASEIAREGDTVLLSPACASLDQYKNYQDRGEQFAKSVLAIANRAKACAACAMPISMVRL